MSYVQVSDIGCGEYSNPWELLVEGPNTQFMFHDGSIATFGRTSNTTPAATTDVMQGWFADQVLRGGWNKGAETFYHSLYSQSYPSQFLPCCLACGMHITVNGTVENYNLGQSYLNNALAWVFLDFPHEAIAYQLLDPISAASPLAPSFTNQQAKPSGVKNVDEFINPKGKWKPLVQHALQQAISANDGLGCCGKSLVFICNTLDRVKPGWSQNNSSITARWWNLTKKNLNQYK